MVCRLNTSDWVAFDGERRVYSELDEDGVEQRFPLLKYFWPDQRRSDKALKELKDWHAEETARYAADPSLEYCPEEELVRYCRLLLPLTSIL